MDPSGRHPTMWARACRNAIRPSFWESSLGLPTSDCLMKSLKHTVIQPFMSTFRAWPSETGSPHRGELTPKQRTSGENEMAAPENRQVGLPTRLVKVAKGRSGSKETTNKAPSNKEGPACSAVPGHDHATQAPSAVALTTSQPRTLSSRQAQVTWQPHNLPSSASRRLSLAHRR